MVVGDHKELKKSVDFHTDIAYRVKRKQLFFPHFFTIYVHYY